MTSAAWRVVARGGEVLEVVAIRRDYGEGCHDYHPAGDPGVSAPTASHAVACWALWKQVDWTELVPPGQLTKAEAVAAETERCARWVDTEANAFRGNLAQCAAWITDGLRAVLALDRIESLASAIRSGKEAPK